MKLFDVGHKGENYENTKNYNMNLFTNSFISQLRNVLLVRYLRIVVR